MQWNASEFGDIKSIHIPAKSVWLPDILLMNRCEFRGFFSLGVVNTKIRVAGDTVQ